MRKCIFENKKKSKKTGASQYLPNENVPHFHLEKLEGRKKTRKTLTFVDG